MNSRTLNPGDYREGVQMARTKARTIVYRYNDDAKSDEEEFDLHGEFAIPERNALIMRHGKLWKTVHVKKESGSSSQTPIVRVFLIDHIIECATMLGSAFLTFGCPRLVCMTTRLNRDR